MRKILIAVLAVGLLLSGSATLAATVKAKAPVKAKTVVMKDIGSTQIKKVATDFIRDYLVGGSQVEVKVKGIVSGLYDLEIKIDGGEVINSRMSIDGKDFYPSVMNLETFKKENKKAAATKPQAATPTVATKLAKPVVEVFVMSHCPYGTQIEKGLLPVAKTLGDKIDLQVKFVDYAMHGEKELTEQLNQYCINKEQTVKFLPYLECFLAEGNTESCLTSTGIDKTKLSACVNATDTKYGVMKSFNDRTGWSGSFPPFAIHKAENDKYGVQGSPTLVVNGAVVNSGRDSASLLATICSAFVTAPKECKTVLSSAAPSAGFGFRASNNSAPAAGCGQ